MFDRLIQGLAPCRPFEHLNDGDLLHLVENMPDIREPGLTKATKVKGHATGEMVVSGQVRGLNKARDGEADKAADFGWRRVSVGY